MNNAGVFTIEGGHPALPGHFPGHPVVPGVVLLDHAVLRIAAALARAPHPSRLASVKFLATVTANEPVTVYYACEADGSVRFVLEAPGRTVASGVLTLPEPASPAR